MEILVDNFVAFILAGQETTASTLSFAVLELAKNKAIQIRCQEEIDEIIGTKTEIDYNDIKKLNYVSMVFKESLRLYPPLRIIPRFIGEQLTINKFKIPQNTSVLVNSIQS